MRKTPHASIKTFRLKRKPWHLSFEVLNENKRKREKYIILCKECCSLNPDQAWFF